MVSFSCDVPSCQFCFHLSWYSTCSWHNALIYYPPPPPPHTHTHTQSPLRSTILIQVLGVHGPTSVYASSRDHNVYQWNVRSYDSPVDSQASSAVYQGHEFVVTTIAGCTSEQHSATPYHKGCICMCHLYGIVVCMDICTIVCIYCMQ